MANSWQYIPDNTIDQDNRRKAAEYWGATQRQQLAAEWAQQQQSDWEQQVAEQRQMRARQQVEQRQPAQQVEQAPQPPQTLDVMSTRAPDQPSLPPPGVQGGTVTSAVSPVTPQTLEDWQRERHETSVRNTQPRIPSRRNVEPGEPGLLDRATDFASRVSVVPNTPLDLALRGLGAFQEHVANPISGMVTEAGGGPPQAEMERRYAERQRMSDWQGPLSELPEPAPRTQDWQGFGQRQAERRAAGIPSIPAGDIPMFLNPGDIPAVGRGLLAGARGLPAEARAVAGAYGGLAQPMAPFGRKLLAEETGALKLGGWKLGGQKSEETADIIATKLKAKYGDDWYGKATIEEWSEHYDAKYLDEMAFEAKLRAKYHSAATTELPELPELAQAIPQVTATKPKVSGPLAQHWQSLTEPVAIDPTVVKSPHFRHWFRQSTVLDPATNSPLPVYHASRGQYGKFNAFRKSTDIGYHFGTRNAAKDRAGVTSTEGERYIGAYYLRIENPLVMNDLGGWGAGSIGDELLSKGVLPRGYDLLKDYYKIQMEARRRFPDNGAARSFLWQKHVQGIIERAGYDGIIYKNMAEDPGSISYIIFHPEQAKSATSNTGAFGIDNPNFLNMPPSVGGAVAGGFVGATQGDTPEESARNAMLGAAGGGLAAKGAMLVAPKLANVAKEVKPIIESSMRKGEAGVLNLGPGGMPVPHTAGNAPPARLARQARGYPIKKVGILEQVWNRDRNILEKQGAAGKELANRVHESRSKWEELAGDWSTRMPTVRKLGAMEFTNLVDVAEGNAQPISQRVTQAAAEWDVVRQEIWAQAQLAGIDMGNITNYFPHRYDPKVLGDTSRWNRALDHLVTTGQAPDRAAAEQMLDKAQEAMHGRYGNLEMSRIVNLPGYEKTKDALFSYIEGSSKRISQAALFGPENEIGARLITKIGEQGFDNGAAREILKRHLGTKEYGEGLVKMSSMIRSYNVLTSMGISFIANASQPINTATVAGAMRTISAIPKAMFSQQAKDDALRIGVTLDGVIRDVREGVGWSGFAGKIGAPLFNMVEKFNRTLTVEAGRSFARDMFTNYARSASTGKIDKEAELALQKMGLDAASILQRGGKLTRGEEINAMRNIVERTQFKVDPQDMPGWASHPLGRLVIQFNSFPYNQTAFIAREIIEPAIKQHNIKPLVTFLVLGLPTGMAAYELQTFLRARLAEQDPIQRIRQYYQRVGSIGVVGNLLAAFAPPNTKTMPGERYALEAAGAVFGPSMGKFLEGAGATGYALAGKPEHLEEFITKQIPIVGPTLKNVLRSGRAETPGTLTHPGREPVSAPQRLEHPGRR